MKKRMDRLMIKKVILSPRVYPRPLKTRLNNRSKDHMLSQRRPRESSLVLGKTGAMRSKNKLQSWNKSRIKSSKWSTMELKLLRIQLTKQIRPSKVNMSIRLTMKIVTKTKPQIPIPILPNMNHMLQRRIKKQHRNKKKRLKKRRIKIKPMTLKRIVIKLRMKIMNKLKKLRMKIMNRLKKLK